jgi:hypothetical protein
VADQRQAVEIEGVGELDRVLGDRRHFSGAERMLALESCLTKPPQRRNDGAVTGLMQQGQQLVPRAPIVGPTVQQNHRQAPVGAVDMTAYG